MELREPLEVSVKDGDGVERKFIISKMPAWDGLEIMGRLPSAILAGSLPKLGDWDIILKLQSKIMKYVAVDINGNHLVLETQALIDNHCSDWECFRNVLWAEVQYNNSFFRNGTALDFLKDIGRQYLAKVLEMLTQYSEQLSPQNSQPSTNSKQSTP